MRLFSLFLVLIFVSGCASVTTRHEQLLMYQLGLLDQHCIGKTAKQQLASLNRLAPPLPANMPEKQRKAFADNSGINKYAVGFASPFGQQLMAFKHDPEVNTTSCAVMISDSDPNPVFVPWLASKYSIRDYDGSVLSSMTSKIKIYAMWKRSGKGDVETYYVVPNQQGKGGYISVLNISRKKFEELQKKAVVSSSKKR